ncbi:hypothetical protein [Mesorhizobium amorphae]|nr:hypothetical protein [Mesorhizobium amorphae]
MGRHGAHMDKQTKGAWVIHHGRKISGDQRGASDYSAIDLAAKAASLLVRLAESKQADLNKSQVIAAARIGGLNPKTELQACLTQLQDRRVIDVAADGSVSVIGVTGRTALGHASDLFDENEPQPFELASIGLAELASSSPVGVKAASEYIGDTYKLTKNDTSDFLGQAYGIGFVDAEGEGDERLLFNGNLFRRNTAEKTKKVLDSLTPAEQASLQQFEQLLKVKGAVVATHAKKMLGAPLLSKLQAAAVFDINVVSNEAGEHAFMTSPGAFHKFTSPLIDDAFDHAKALVSALSYGMSQSTPVRGRIWGVELILAKLLRGEAVGPAPAIGSDYRALEFERVVQITRTGNGYFTMRLLKMEVGQIALQVLKGGDAAAAALEVLPSAGMSGYTPPEAARTDFRTKKQGPQSKSQMRTLLSAVRGGGSL